MELIRCGMQKVISDFYEWFKAKCSGLMVYEWLKNCKNRRNCKERRCRFAL
ncbi:MAG: hypothetical protein IJ748_01370 [Bacteroidales bacterium]|nr:hypothetical protein [Bacteroidales bacterium]